MGDRDGGRLLGFFYFLGGNGLTYHTSFLTRMLMPWSFLMMDGTAGVIV